MKRLGIFGGGIHFAIISITQPFFSLYASELGASTALIGLLVTLKALLPLFIAMPSGQMIDRFGAPVMLHIGNVATVASLALMVWSPNLSVLALSQLLVGAGTLLMASSLQVIVSEGDREERERNIARYSAWSSAGTMIGPLVGGAIVTAAASWALFEGVRGSEAGYRAAFIFSLLLAVAFMLMFAAVSRKSGFRKVAIREMGKLLAPREMVGSYVGGAHLLKHSGVQFGLVSTFMIHYLQSIWMSFFPLYLDGIGYSALMISVLVSVRGFAGFISRAFLPVLTKRISHERILISAGCVAALAMILLPVLNWHVLLIGVISFILGSAVGVNMPVSTMIMVTDDNRHERGKLMGLRLFANRISQIVAPAMFGAIGQTIGLTMAFYTGGGVLFALMAGFGAYSRWKGRSAPLAESGDTATM